MSEFRKDPVTGRWVILAPERSLRPSDFVSAAGGAGEEEGKRCPFCPGHEALTPEEILAVPDPSGAGWSVRVIPNKFPALRIEEPLRRSAAGIYDRVSGVGAHEVIVETPRHDLSLAHVDDTARELVLRAYRDRLGDLSRDDRLRWGMVFKNRGAEAGATVRHEHSQLVALPMIPREPLARLSGAAEHWARKERCIYCDVIEHERKEGARIVAESERFLAFCPYASRAPFETWIMPRRHISHFERGDDGDLPELSELLGRVLRKLDLGLEGPALNFMLHSGPLQEPNFPSFHWHLEIAPSLLRTGGFEWGSGFYINATPPEEAARFLRRISP